MGVGEGIGSDGPGEQERREREGGGGSAYWWVLVLVLSEQTTAWFSLSFFPPFGVFGWVLFGYVLCPLSLLCGDVACCVPLAHFLSPQRKGMERPSSKLLRARTGKFVDIWSFYSLSPLLILPLSPPHPLLSPSLAFSLSLYSPPLLSLYLSPE